MQTGQNSIAPENSLPQIEQVRWGSVRMGLTGPPGSWIYEIKFDGYRALGKVIVQATPRAVAVQARCHCRFARPLDDRSRQKEKWP